MIKFLKLSEDIRIKKKLFNSKTYLVTGAAGFIGSTLSSSLLEKGYRVIGLDNLNDFYSPELKKYRIRNLSINKNFSFIKGDIRNKSELSKLFKDHTFDSVYHLAGCAGVRHSLDDPEMFISTNTTGTINILNCMKDYGINKILLASTSSLYAGFSVPFHEEMPANKPISPYAVSKKAAEMMAYTYHYLYKIDVIVARYFTVYGPMGRPDMAVLRFIKRIDQCEEIELYGDGKQTRDFTYVQDIVDGSIIASEKSVGFEVYNIGGGYKPITMLELISILESQLRKKAKVKYLPQKNADIYDSQADVEKTIRLLGWRSSTQIEDGLKKTIEWYKNNKEICGFI